MSIIAIEGHRFDTSKAKRYYEITYFDGNNWNYGALYMSRKGTWYVQTPSQWANGHCWELIHPADAIERYADYLAEDKIKEIMQLAGLETE